MQLLGFSKSNREELEEKGEKKVPEIIMIHEILEIVKEIRDELRPLGPDGQRVSKLELILAALASLNPEEREVVRKRLEILETDEEILRVLDEPKTIEEIAAEIGRSYGYTATRLRELMKAGKVMRKRDARTRKFVYLRVSG